MKNRASTTRTVERRIFTSFFQDGFIEALTGIFLLEIGLTVLLSRAGYGDLRSAVNALVAALALLAAAFAARRYLVLPRLGRVKFLPERRRKLSRLIIVPTLAIIGGVVLSYLASQGVSTGNTAIAIVPLSFTPIAVFCAAAWFLDLNRLYLYGAIAGLVMPLGKYLDRTTASPDALPTTMLFASFVFLGMAGVFFANFMMNHRSAEVRKR